MCTQPKGTMGKSKALETALNNKLLSSHEHLEKGVFSPTPPVHKKGGSVTANKKGAPDCNRRGTTGARIEDL